MKDHNAVVNTQFGEQASAYLTSAVHAQGKEFTLLQQLLSHESNATLLDLGCGAGHVSFHLAPLVKKVIAYDLSIDMLNVVQNAAQQKKLNNIETCEGIAERLPFSDNSFDFVVSRYSAHHWQDLGLALREVRRVLKPKGIAVFIDVTAPEQPLLSTFLQTVEILRDTSHVRDYSVAEWLQQLGQSRLIVTQHHRQRLHLEFSSWVERMRTPQTFREAILALQMSVAQEVRDYFEVDEKGSFSTDVSMIWVTKV